MGFFCCHVLLHSLSVIFFSFVEWICDYRVFCWLFVVIYIFSIDFVLLKYYGKWKLMIFYRFFFRVVKKTSKAINWTYLSEYFFYSIFISIIINDELWYLNSGIQGVWTPAVLKYMSTEIGNRWKNWFEKDDPIFKLSLNEKKGVKIT